MAWAEPIPDSEVERALVVTAHPDDADYGAAGTIAGWVDAGIAVTLLLCTRGEQGGFDETPRSEMPAIRERDWPSRKRWRAGCEEGEDQEGQAEQGRLPSTGRGKHTVIVGRRLGHNWATV